MRVVVKRSRINEAKKCPLEAAERSCLYIVSGTP